MEIALKSVKVEVTMVSHRVNGEEEEEGSSVDNEQNGRWKRNGII
jgi:hypothetical protein